MAEKQHVKTVFISDIHLWNPKNQSNKLIEFLKTIEFDNLIIVWDFLDYWQLNWFWLWREKEKNTLDYINKLSNEWINITYIQGNHDSGLICNNNIYLNKVSIRENMFYETKKWKIYYIMHWHLLDWANWRHSKVWKIGSLTYWLWLKIESIRNKEAINPCHNSISEKIEDRIRIHRFPQNKLTNKIKKFSKNIKCDWIIIWHFHQPEHRNIDWLDYFNTWDRLKNCSAVIETDSWNLELLIYKKSHKDN